MAKRREELIKEGRSNDDSISFRFSFHFFLTYRETDSHRLIRNANPFESKRLALIPRSKRFERQSSYRACVYQEKRTGHLLIPTISLMNFVRSDESIIPAIISLSLCVDDGGICVCVCVCVGCVGTSKRGGACDRMNRTWLVAAIEASIKKSLENNPSTGRGEKERERYIASTSRIGFKFNSQLNLDRRKKDTASHALLAWFTITDHRIDLVCTYTSLGARVRACLIRRDWLDSRRSNSNTCEALYERRVARRNKSYCNESGL